MDVLLGLPYYLVMLGILITAHEYGHYRVAVEAFLDGRLRFDAIHHVNAGALERVLPETADAQSLEALLALDARARHAARAHVASLAGKP